MCVSVWGNARAWGAAGEYAHDDDANTRTTREERARIHARRQKERRRTFRAFERIFRPLEVSRHLFIVGNKSTHATTTRGYPPTTDYTTKERKKEGD